MELILISLLAGVLTVLSPCILPLLPVVLAGSSTTKAMKTPLVIIGSLAVSVFVFTLILRASTALIGVPSSFWFTASGLLITLIGLSFMFPQMWTMFAVKLGLQAKAHSLTAASHNKTGLAKNVLLGASLGPVFTSCSPTYGIILATVLPASFSVGIVNLLAYIVGLSGILLAVAIGGQKFVSKLGWATNPYGVFRRGLGVLLVVTGLLIATGVIKDIEAWLVSAGIDATRLERSLLE